jgi:hypothetical protein
VKKVIQVQQAEPEPELPPTPPLIKNQPYKSSQRYLNNHDIRRFYLFIFILLNIVDLLTQGKNLLNLQNKMIVIMKGLQNMQFRLEEGRVKFRMNLKSLQEIMDVESQITMIQPMIIVIVTHVVLENFVFVMIVKIQATV